MYETEQKKERVILVGISLSDAEDVDQSLDELEELARTAGAECVGRVIQKRELIHPGTYVGKGKLDEIRDLLWETEADGIICDDELSPAQIGNLKDELHTKIMDRTLLILDIFAARASTNEGKIQVELAQLKYRQSRLTGYGTSLSRLGGGIGTRGPGEKKLETDRRHIERRMEDIKKELADLRRTRGVQRTRREKSGIPVVALVGYTNSGKSALMNSILSMTDKEEKTVVEKDMLFATLDAQSRGVTLDTNHRFILVDTVGFVSKLPHSLVEAFKATLEEVLYADLLLHVVDSSYEENRFHIDVTNKVLEEIGAAAKEKVMVFNKIDLAPSFEAPVTNLDNLFVSAKTGENLDLLIEKIKEIIFTDISARLLIPYARGDLSSYLCEKAEVKSMEYVEEGTLFDVELRQEDYQRLKKYEVI